MKGWHRRRRVGPQTERASQLSRAKTCAGWAPHWLHGHAQPARWINFGSFAKAYHGKSFYLGFLLFIEQQQANKYYSLTKKIRSLQHFLKPPAIDKEPESNAKMYANQRRDETVRTRKHILRHEHFRAKHRHGSVFPKAVFDHFPLEDFSQTNGNRLVGAPRAHFRQKLKIDK